MGHEFAAVARHSEPGRETVGPGTNHSGVIVRLSAAVLHIQHIASLGLPSRQAIPEMVDALQFVVPSSVNTFVWLGEHGEPIDLYERHPITEALDAFMMQTPHLEATGEPSFVKLIKAKGEFGNWWQFTAFDGWNRSVMKNELFRPYNIGNNMDFLIKDRDRPVALLTINREPGSAAFRQHEINAVLGLRAHFVHAMRGAANAIYPSEVVAEGEVATAIVDRHGRILDMSARAGLFLHQLNCGSEKIPLTAERVPNCVDAVMNRLANVTAGYPGPPASEDIRTPWCTMRVTAHPMNRSDMIILSMHRYIPVSIVRLRNAAREHLTPSERRVAWLMCSELETHQIASAAGVTETSLREYSKRIRAKLNVGSRDSVRAKLSVWSAVE